MSTLTFQEYDPKVRKREIETSKYALIRKLNYLIFNLLDQTID